MDKEKKYECFDCGKKVDEDHCFIYYEGYRCLECANDIEEKESKLR